MNAIIFGRVSTAEQMQTGHSIAAQIEVCRQYCKKMNLKIIQEHEIDESSTKNNRKKFSAVLQFVEKQSRPVALVVETIDRLLRTFRDLPKIEILIHGGQLELHCLRENLHIHKESTSDVKMRLHMGVVMASSYVNQLSDNVKRSIRQRIQEGQCIGKAPFGYENVTDESGKKTVEVNRVHAAAVSKMYKSYASGAESMEGLRALLKSEFGLKISKGQIDAILKNPFYYGMMRFKGKLYPHIHGQIISKQDFDRVQEMKASHRKKKIKYRGKPFVYRSLIRCAACGCSITSEKKKNKFIYYHCTRAKGRHDAPWVREEAVTTQLKEQLHGLKMPVGKSEEILSNLNRASSASVRLRDQEYDSLKKQQTIIMKRLDALYVDKLDEKISEAEYVSHRRKYEIERQEVYDRIHTLENEQQISLISLDRLQVLLEQAPVLFSESSIESRRRLIKHVFKSLELPESGVLKAEKYDSFALVSSQGQQFTMPA